MKNILQLLAIGIALIISALTILPSIEITSIPILIGYLIMVFETVTGAILISLSITALVSFIRSSHPKKTPS